VRIVITGPDNLFALPEIEPLLREELDRVAPLAARQPAGRALIVQACVANRHLGVDVRQLAALRVQVQDRRYVGDVVCAVDALPWEDAAFNLVVAQHVGDALPHAHAGTVIEELARVLAPGGALLWFGLNPWSPWLAWTHWQGRHGLPAPNTRHVDTTRRHLLRQRLALAGLDLLGTCWPQRGSPSAIHRSAVLAPLRCAYLVTATRQRAAMTPLRPHFARERVAMQPQLSTPSRRASA
jgi:SAM-dependent methyltransferase